jgi:hypothetical protein
MTMYGAAPSRHIKPEDKPWEGEWPQKPWDYKVSIVIPQADTTAQIKLARDLWRMQTVKPYFVLIDCGSTCQGVYDLLKLRCFDTEVHVVRCNGYRHPSEPVASSMDLAFSVVNSEYLFATHSDVFPRRRDILSHWLEKCGPLCPVVGYQMSPRPSGPWLTTPSHTATMYYLASMDRIRASWSMRRGRVLYWPHDPGNGTIGKGWPDTESLLGYQLRDTGTAWNKIGSEANHRRYGDEWIDHVRSYGSSLIYSPEYHDQAEAWMKEAMAEADERLDKWKGEVRGQPEPD